MLPLLMMGLYRTMFPMMPQAPAQAAASGGGKKGGGGSGGSGGSAGAQPQKQEEAKPTLNLFDLGMHGLRQGSGLKQDFSTPLWSAANLLSPQNVPTHVRFDKNTGKLVPDYAKASKVVPDGLEPKSGEAARRQYMDLFPGRPIPPSLAEDAPVKKQNPRTQALLGGDYY